MLVGICIVIRSSCEILSIMYAYSHLIKTWTHMEKRSFRLLLHSEHSTLLPMIPGLTLPISHLHYYFVALLVGALLHELGHGLCAGLHNLRLCHSGFFFSYIYPGAFISIAESDLDMLGVWQKLQIICAGIWHNIVLFGICKMLNKVASRWIWCHLGWQMLSDGVSVVNIHASSPLAPHLKPGTRIIQLDDTPLLHGTDDWRSFWNRDFATTPTHGFCALMGATTFTDTSCCAFASDLPFGDSSDSTISCFQNASLGDTEVIQGECLNTLQTLAAYTTVRCRLDADCLGNSTCVIPVTPSMYGQRVRIYAENEGQELITSIYEGALRDVLDSVQVSNLHPKYPCLPKQLPHQFDLLTRQVLKCLFTLCYTYLTHNSYVATFSLTLALLNSVPAFNLDGASILKKLLFNTQKKLFTVITKIMSGLVLFVVIGSVFILLLQNL
ncbi:membrane-bound transcription factor site-2 protease [Mucor ambiguus]|uniref:Endopeptidase S2P n=1 Tax=Mucor ambiguus TaxID=91626 RepID=A0A0C9MMV4_9FUNG|nr:membrane-bound transcription factor site-2 protease [Mucor ambiguus]